MTRHLGSIAEIVEDMAPAVRLYRDVLGFTVKYEEGAGYAQVEMPGVLHFGIWQRAFAAEVVFGDRAHAERVPLGFSLGFEVDEVAAETAAMKAKGWQFVQEPRKEDWGQITSRFLAASGGLCEIAETPWARRITQPLQAGED